MNYAFLLLQVRKYLPYLMYKDALIGMEKMGKAPRWPVVFIYGLLSMKIVKNIWEN
jgi:hypothetical protein